MIKLLKVYWGWIGLILILSACVSTGYDPEAAQRRAEERQAERLARGQVILADCIATCCEKLDLDGTDLPSFSVLNDLEHIKVLMISFTSFSDLRDISKMSQLEELHIRRTHVSDLSTLHNFKRLKLLHAGGVKTEADQRAISQLINLEELVVDYVDSKDFAFLTPLRNLKRFSSEATSGADLTPLGKLSKLETLELGNVEDVTPLLRLKRLKQVRFNHVSEEQSALLEARGVTVETRPIMVVC